MKSNISNIHENQSNTDAYYVYLIKPYISGDGHLYELPKSDLVDEIIKLRGTISNLTKTVNHLSVNSTS